MKISLRNRRHDGQRNPGFTDELHSSLSRVERTGLVAKVIMKISFAIDADIHLGVNAFQKLTVRGFEQRPIGADRDYESWHFSRRFEHLIKASVHKGLAACEIKC